MNNNQNNLIYWLPRILAILFIAFLIIPAFKAFSSPYIYPYTVLAFLMYLVPPAVLAAATAIAWKWEKRGAMIFFCLGILYLILAWNARPLANIIGIAGASVVIGALFLYGKTIQTKPF